MTRMYRRAPVSVPDDLTAAVGLFTAYGLSFGLSFDIDPA